DIYLWDLSGNLLQSLKGHTANIVRLHFIPPGKKLISAGWDGTVRRWDLATARGEIIIDQPGMVINDLALSPDNRQIALASSDQTIQIWQMESLDQKPAELLNSFKGSEDNISSLAWSPDGRLLASVGDDKKIDVWHNNGPLLATLSGHKASINSVCFTTDNQTLISGSDDSTVRLWRLDNILNPVPKTKDLDELLRRACRWLDDYLQYSLEDDSGVCDG
ncbi:MAG: hypothetical protein GY869_30580, partial [Planctomycetes bacterium]|nr:hypothetical protein [Planctomycetota bacterium]